MAPLPPRVRLVVLFGGRSAEHDVSCISATHVLAAVDASRYDVVPVGIDRDGRWRLSTASAALVAGGRSAELPERLDATAGEEVDPLTTVGSAPSDGDVPTVVLPILHGPNGEDGTVQGLLELAGLPYVGSGVLGSAVAMDKAMANTVLAAAGVPQARWRALRSHEPFDAAGILHELGPVVFAKPANMGSSIGVSRVTDAPSLAEAVRGAFAYDEVVVLEEGLVARELECAVLGNDEPRASVVGEIVAGAEFYDYTDKYFDGRAREVVPADVPPDVTRAVQDLAVRCFGLLRCSGMARVDTFLEERAPDGGPGRGVLVNEVNTIPGFTPISMYPKLWAASGLRYPALIDELVRLALERHERRSAFLVTPS